MRIALSVACTCLLLAPGQAGADDVVLQSGSRLQGTVLKRSDQKIWLDVGPDVLVFDLSDVAEVIIDGSDEGEIEVLREDSLDRGQPARDEPS